jgi:hypothetical protein
MRALRRRCQAWQRRLVLPLWVLVAYAALLLVAIRWGGGNGGLRLTD